MLFSKGYDIKCSGLYAAPLISGVTTDLHSVEVFALPD